MYDICTRCGGEGSVNLICLTCNGSGEGMYDGTICRDCGKSGRVREICPVCDGTGEMWEEDRDE